MLKRLRQRVLDAAIVLAVVSCASFFLVKLLPGDPVLKILGDRQDPARYEALRHEMGLDRPVLAQYVDWLQGLLSGDLGRSLTPPQGEIMAIMKAATPVTLELTVLALVLSLVFAVPTAMWCAYRQGGLVDRALTTVLIGVMALPHFVIAFLLIFAFVMLVPVAPRLGWVGITEDLGGNLSHAMLPATALAIPMAALFQQILRDDLVATLREDYIVTATAVGQPPARVMVFWALRPALLSLVTVVGISVGYVIGATAIVEVMFGLPGLGLLLVNSISEGDVPVVQAVVLVVTAAFVLLNTSIDILYGYLDPRIRRAATK